MRTTFTLFAVLMAATLSAQTIEVSFEGRYTDGNEGACEITAYDKAAKRLYITNAYTNKLDIVDLSNVAAPALISSFDIAPYGGGVNSVVNEGNGYLALAVEATVKQNNGSVVIIDTAGTFVAEVEVGALPDMITITPDGTKLLVANEGEPDDDYLVDPDGSVSIIDISGGIQNISQSNVTTLTFTNAPATIPGSLRKGSTPYTQDLEPEYIAVDAASKLAAVTCQESNVIVFIDLETSTISSYKGLGFKDYSSGDNKLDASDRDDMINIRNWPVKGVYMPDAISSATIGGSVYWFTANEGDGRDYDGYSSEVRVKDLMLDASFAADIQDDENLGRLKTFTTDVIGDTDNDGDVDEIYTYGGRSFSIWDADGDLVWDSKAQFEEYFASNYPAFFNCNDGLASEMDGRSDDKGPEPEAICIGTPQGATYAFIGLERQGGILVYNVTNPMSPEFATFIHSFDTVAGTMTDIAPEGLIYVPADQSHTGKNLLIVSSEVSGTVAIYSVDDSYVSVNETAVSKINMYPNPADDMLTIDLADQQMSYQADVYTTTGKRVISTTLKGSGNQIDISSLAAGTYVVTLVSYETQTQITAKFVKK